MTKNINSKWLSFAVFYQIYPQSFNDTNGDGIGDIQGNNARSLLNKVRKLTALRKETPALQADGKFKVSYAELGEYPLVYLREFWKWRFIKKSWRQIY